MGNPNLRNRKRGIIFGALDSNSIAWKTAERVHEEGGTFVLTNAPVAMRMGQINELAAKTGSQIIPADFFLVKNKNGISISSAIVFHITETVVQVIYWGDLPNFSELKK